jgi:hypothetical protein
MALCWEAGIRVIAKQFGVDPGTGQRISRPFEQPAVALRGGVNGSAAQRAISLARAGSSIQNDAAILRCHNA